MFRVTVRGLVTFFDMAAAVVAVGVLNHATLDDRGMMSIIAVMIAHATRADLDVLSRGRDRREGKCGSGQEGGQRHCLDHHRKLLEGFTAPGAHDRRRRIQRHPGSD